MYNEDKKGYECKTATTCETGFTMIFSRNACIEKCETIGYIKYGN